VKESRYLLQLLAAPILTACVSIEHHPIPTDWGNPRPIVKDTCADIGGTFNGYGEQGEPKSAEQKRFQATESLYCGLCNEYWSRFERKAWGPYKTITHIAIEQAGDVLKVSAFEAATLIAQKEIRKSGKDGYQCATEGIVVGGQNVPPENILGYIGETHTLFKFFDGSLGVKTESTGGGLGLGVIPMFGSGTYWHRYQTYQSRNDS
jgi:hypothetical protein